MEPSTQLKGSKKVCELFLLLGHLVYPLLWGVYVTECLFSMFSYLPEVLVPSVSPALSLQVC